jgi:hypothetical protein
MSALETLHAIKDIAAEREKATKSTDRRAWIKIGQLAAEEIRRLEAEKKGQVILSADAK